jgi:hypothetical protein
MFDQRHLGHGVGDVDDLLRAAAARQAKWLAAPKKGQVDPKW